MSVLDNAAAWRYPDALRLGKLEHDTEYELILHLLVPVPCKLTAKVSGMAVEPESLVPGKNEVILRVESLDRDTLLSGSLWLCTTGMELPIRVEGHAVFEPDGRPLVPKRKLAWEPVDWDLLDSWSDSLPPPPEPISPDPLIGSTSSVVIQPPSSGPNVATVKAPAAVATAVRAPVAPPPKAPALGPVKVGIPSSFTKERVEERWKGAGFYLVRTDRFNSQDIVYALRSVCTHQGGCTVAWNPYDKKFKCSCKGSGYNLSGISFEGPPARPLERLKVSLANDGQIVVDPRQKFQQELGQWSDHDSYIVVPPEGVVAQPVPPPPRPRISGKLVLATLLVGAIVGGGGYLVQSGLIPWPPAGPVVKEESKPEPPKEQIGSTTPPRTEPGLTPSSETTTKPSSVTEASASPRPVTGTGTSPEPSPDPATKPATIIVEPTRPQGPPPPPSDEKAPNGTRLVLIPSGSFRMGADDPMEPHDGPAHPVSLTRPFYLGEAEVTQAEWRSVMTENPNPSWFSPTSAGSGKEAVEGRDTEQFPVESITWLDAIQFCNRLSEAKGLPPYYTIVGKTVTIADRNGPGYRLPTEAEWEYACRAGSGSTWSFGNLASELTGYAWFSENADERTHPVREKQPNPFHLYGMYGNVAEWCWDWDAPYPRSTAAVVNPIGPSEGELRVIRGGAWNSVASEIGNAHRSALLPDRHFKDTGFRVARTLPEPVP